MSTSRRRGGLTGGVVGEFELLERIGKGSFATVYRARSKKTGRDGAVKAISRSKVEHSKKLLGNLDTEIAILQSLQHPNIVQLLDVKKSEKYIFLTFEFCAGGDLSDFIKARRAVAEANAAAAAASAGGGEGEQGVSGGGMAGNVQSPQPTRVGASGGGGGGGGMVPPVGGRRTSSPGPNAAHSAAIIESSGSGIGLDVIHRILSQLAAGLEYCRSHSLIHRDLKPQNLLLTSLEDDAVLKIADFGFAKSLAPEDQAKTLCGSPLYMAPEILKSQAYDAKADLWSVGVILYELVVGRPPYRADNALQLVSTIEQAQKSPLPFPRSLELPADLLDLIGGLLRANPVARISFDEFFMHPFLQSCRAAAPGPAGDLVPLPNPNSRHLAGSSGSSGKDGPLGELPAAATVDVRMQPRTISPGPSGGHSAPRGLAAIPNRGEVKIIPGSGKGRSMSPGGMAAIGPMAVGILSGADGTSGAGVATGTGGVLPALGSSPLAGGPLIQRSRSGGSIAIQTTPPTSPLRKPRTNPFRDEEDYVVVGPSSTIASAAQGGAAGSGASRPSRTAYVVDHSEDASIGGGGDGEDSGKGGVAETEFQPMLRRRSVGTMVDEAVLDLAGISVGEVIAGLDNAYQRVVAVVGLGNTRVTAGKPEQGLALFVKALEMMRSKAAWAKAAVANGLGGVTPGLETAFGKHSSLFSEVLRSAKMWRSRLPEGGASIPAETLMYEHALSEGREAGVEESMGFYAAAAQRYSRAALFLHQLLSEPGLLPGDRDVLSHYVSGFEERLRDLAVRRVKESVVSPGSEPPIGASRSVSSPIPSPMSSATPTPRSTGSSEDGGGGGGDVKASPGDGSGTEAGSGGVGIGGPSDAPPLDF